MEKPPVMYFKEISLMMYGFGDSHEPNPETVRLVETIVLKQLKTIVREALKYASGNRLKAENLVFLLRHNKTKMQRFVRYWHNRLMKNKLTKLESGGILDLDEKPKDDLLDFIEEIDETGEFTDLTQIDEVNLERQIRADRRSQAMNEEKYLKFHKARRASFRHAQGELKLLKYWVDPEDLINFDKAALEVLSYFAFQTVAEIVDYALLVRTDAKSSTDPLQHLPGSYYSSVMFNKFDDNNPDYSSVHLNQPPITVNEIKEVMRRVHTPQAGKLNFGGKFPDTHYMFAL